MYSVYKIVNGKCPDNGWKIDREELWIVQLDQQFDSKTTAEEHTSLK